MAAYALSNHYAGASLLSGFDFFSGTDRSNGFVNYLNQDAAMAHGLASVQDGNHVRLGVDSTTFLSTNDTGRPSVMLTSKESFTHGLFIADFDHMPASSCGSWPSFWAFNNNDEAVWPKGGEIGIIEGANNAQRNLYSAHTDKGCNLPDTGFLGNQGPEQCDSKEGHLGCHYAAPARDPTSYGDAFNAADGGVYALEWDDAHLKMWHFPRAGIPIDIQVGRPQPSKWGLPHALFGGSGCDADTYFYNMSLVLNINFCGNYAGNLWTETDTCNQLASSCEAYVAGHPEAYTEAYWDVRYIDVYEKKAAIANNGSRPSSGPSRPSARPVSPASDVVTKTVTLSQAPAPTTGPLGLKRIDGYVLLGCHGSKTSFEAFNKTLSSKSMTNSLCISTCRKLGKPFSGVSHDTCYCASDLGDASAQGLTSCTTPCPGDGSQFCGGPQRNRSSSSQAGGNGNSTTAAGLLTIYGNLAKEPLPPNAPGKGNDGEDGTIMTRVAYTAICSANSAELCEYGYYATVTAENACAITTSGADDNCTRGGLNQTNISSHVYASVPMATITQTCNGCGPKNESTVTLTVPAVVAATASGAIDEDITVTLVQTVLPLVGEASSPAATGGVATTQYPVAAAGTAPGPSMAWMSTGSSGLLLPVWISVLGVFMLF
ncbi:concanavalin A-like lectin/glucanase domain-containing protein [Microdochium bolleyi]|uniref:Concanavalin A-like lectin/glucanase domain-containing protein n=1 Tax=Microdochium bolleyi TaxID=196109 RepID=A0A136JE23_9PEZI|nr:concanavalin A-like lectin/glucanase domain-containing protein [Microdochium bolleyi]